MAGRAAVLWKVTRDPQLRRLEFSFIGFAFAEHATWLAILFYAYERGGAAEAGLLAVVQLLPAMVVAPFAAYAGDRFRAERVLSAGYAAQSISMTSTGIAMWLDRPLIAFAAATIASSCITFSRPVTIALLPTITQTPSDLVAANVVIGLVEDAGMVLGPLVCGLLLSRSGPALVFAVCGAATASSAIASRGLQTIHRPAVDGFGAGDVLRGVGDGLRAIRSHASLRALISMVVIGAVVLGVTDVLMVLFAEARLSGGGGSAGVLGTAGGIGAVVGAIASAGLIGRARITPYLLASAVVFSAAFIALSGVDVLIVAATMYALFGVAGSLLGVTSAVGMQRLSPDDFLTRIFGVSEGLRMGALALGSFTVSLAVRAIGLGPALLVIGGLVLISMGWTTARFRRLGGDVAPPPAEVIDRLLQDPVFELLSAPALARLAGCLTKATFAKGTTIIREGDAGDLYYLIVDGIVAVTVQGAHVRTMGPGQSFGEIALLRDLPRTATVTSITDVDVFEIARQDFLAAVTGHPQSLATASDVVRGFIDLPDAEPD